MPSALQQGGSAALLADTALAQLSGHIAALPIAGVAAQAVLGDPAASASLSGLISRDSAFANACRDCAGLLRRDSRDEASGTHADHARLAAVAALLLAVPRAFAGPDGARTAGAQPSEDGYWLHAAAVACAAWRMAALLPSQGVHPLVAFTAGWLHDLGKPALAAAFPRATERIYQAAAQTRSDLLDHERRVLGIDHALVGRVVAEKWCLPRYCVETVWLHHLATAPLPPSVSSVQLLRIVQLADTLARELSVGVSGNFAFFEPATEQARRIGLTEAQLAGIAASLASDSGHCLRWIQAHMRPSPAVASTPQPAQPPPVAHVSHSDTPSAARYFDALTALDQRLTASSELGDLVAALAEIAGRLFETPRAVALAHRSAPESADASFWTVDGPAQSWFATPISAATWSAISRDRSYTDSVFMAAPHAWIAWLTPLLGEQNTRGSWWLAPIRHDGQVVAGLLIAAEAPPTAADKELRAFFGSIGLAIGRVAAQQAARRLSDDLADTNRRLQHMRAEVLRSRTLSMIAEMAAGAGHELNSPLAVISGRAQLLLDAATDPALRRSLQIIHDKAHEASRIVSELMDFARPTPPTLALLDAGQVASAARRAWLAESGFAPARVSLGGGQPVARVLADAAQLELAFLELLRNAGDAVATNDGSVRIDWTVSASSGGGAETGSVEFIVSDSGIGITPAVAQRAFDPFFSHHAAGRRRGLGLPRAFRIIESHGGRIWLDSRPGEGTAVHVVLPLAGRGES